MTGKSGGRGSNQVTRTRDGMLKRAARERIAEGVMIETLPWRDRWLIYAAYPRKAVRYFGLRLAKWSTLPGDVWFDIQRNQFFVVVAVKPEYVEAEVYSRQIWDTPEIMAHVAALPRVRVTDPFIGWTGPAVSVARFDRWQMAGWMKG